MRYAIDFLGGARYQKTVLEYPLTLVNTPLMCYASSMKSSDRINKIFGKYKVLELLPKTKGARRVFYKVECLSCGKIYERCDTTIRVNQVGCGLCQRKFAHYKTHGKTRTKEYRAWCNIKTRCYNKDSTDYKNYGARGISVSDSWLDSFETFFKDIGFAPSEKHQIDRIDVNKGYSKENCRWANATEQANNRRKSDCVHLPEKSYTTREIEERYGIKPLEIKQYMANRRKKGLKPTHTEAFYFLCLKQGKKICSSD